MSSGYAVANGLPFAEDPRMYHPGLGIAARRELWEDCGGLYNGPLGNGDWMLVAAVLGKIDGLKASLQASSRNYWRDYSSWAASINRWLGVICPISSDALHFWHGSKRDRQYLERISRLRDFDPTMDIEQHPITLLPEWSLTARMHKSALITDVASYFSVRREDEDHIES
jgi:hypothetical protein